MNTLKTQNPIVVSSTPIQTQPTVMGVSNLPTAIQVVKGKQIVFTVNGVEYSGEICQQFRRFPASSGFTIVKVPVDNSTPRIFIIHETGQSPVAKTEVEECNSVSGVVEWNKIILAHQYIEIPESRWA